MCKASPVFKVKDVIQVGSSEKLVHVLCFYRISPQIGLKSGQSQSMCLMAYGSRHAVQNTEYTKRVYNNRKQNISFTHPQKKKKVCRVEIWQTYCIPTYLILYFLTLCKFPRYDEYRNQDKNILSHQTEE